MKHSNYISLGVILTAFFVAGNAQAYIYCYHYQTVADQKSCCLKKTTGNSWCQQTYPETAKAKANR